MKELTFNQPSRPKGLKMVSESKFCAEFENPFLSCRTGGFKAPERVNYPTSHFFPNLPKSEYIPIISLLMHQMTCNLVDNIIRGWGIEW